MNHGCTVVIPTRNRRDRLMKTLATVATQTYAPLEILVSDDGSSDGTKDAVEALNDDRVAVIRSDSGSGVAAARNRGIDAASGRWVAFCDDDDMWAPGKIAGQIATLCDTDTRWGYCGVVDVDDNLRPLRAAVGPPSTPFAHRLVFGNKVGGGCSSAIVEKSLLDEVGRFDTDFSMFADLDLWVRLAEVGEPCVWLDYGVLYVHHPAQMSVIDMPAISRELHAFRDKHRKARATHSRQPYETLDRWIVQRLWSSGQRTDAVRHAVNAKGREGFARCMLTIVGVEWRRLRLQAGSPESSMEAETLEVLESVRHAVAGPSGSFDTVRRQ